MSDYSSLTVVKLKDELKERGLPVSGKKADLIERLQEHDRQNAAQEPEEEVVATNGEAAAIDEAPATSLEAYAPPSELRTETREDVEEQESSTDVQAEGSLEAADDFQPLAPAVNKVEEKQVNEQPQQDQHMEEAPVVIEEQHKSLDSSGNEAMPEPPSINDTQAMPAPELSASQMAQPSVETQEPEPAEPEPVQMDTSADTITRTTTISSANTQEVLEDTKKRKRRSQSPPITSTEVALKKAKAIDGSPRATVVENGKEALPAEDEMQVDLPAVKDEAIATQPQSGLDDEDRTRDRQPSESEKLPSDVPMVERSVAPSRHIPTNFLYISNLMRPLQPNALKSHVEDLARPLPGDVVDETAVFFLESTRRYALISFSSLNEASRVRSSFHDRVWPDESNRKPLFVDFITEEVAKELIQMEEENANKPRLNRKRFEILYFEKEGEIVPEIHDADSFTAKQYHTGQNNGSAKYRKDSIAQTKLPPAPVEESGKNFKALDDLFSFTATKPRLYYLPVSSEVANRRLDVLAHATNRGDGDIRPSDEKKRYTFEDDQIVDKGPEFGFNRGGGGGRGGRGGYSGYGGERGYRGRGRGGHRGDYGGNPRNDYRSGAGIGYHDRW